MTIAENLFLNNLKRFTRFGMLQRAAMGRAAETLMRRYDVRASGPQAPMATLSGGNQQKAVLARELSTDGLVFLLAAQPTRGLDIGALAAVYERIREARDRGVGVLLISSELDELIAVADRILVIFRGRVVGEQPASHASREAIGRLMAGETSERVAA
jgi:general nucleoside transport system ATP-binding protein